MKMQKSPLITSLLAYFIAGFVCKVGALERILFVHGLRPNSQKQYTGLYTTSYFSKKNEADDHYLFMNPIAAFDFPEDKEFTDIGQKEDLAIFLDAYNRLAMAHEYQDGPEEKVLYGQSRGASLIIRFLAEKQPSVRLAILETPFAHVADVIAHAPDLPLGIGKWWIPTWAKKVVATFMHKYILPRFFCPKYNPNDMHPIDHASKIHHQTTLLFVCSKEDEMTPPSSIIKLYEKVIKSGHPNAYLLILDQGAHCDFFNWQEHHKYRAAVHALLKRTGYSHDPESATQGEEILLHSKLTLDQIKSLKKRSP